jgi:hypothetical protein
MVQEEHDRAIGLGISAETIRDAHHLVLPRGIAGFGNLVGNAQDRCDLVSGANRLDIRPHRARWRGRKPGGSGCSEESDHCFDMMFFHSCFPFECFYERLEPGTALFQPRDGGVTFQLKCNRQSFRTAGIRRRRKSN